MQENGRMPVLTGLVLSISDQSLPVGSGAGRKYSIKHIKYG